MPSPCNALAGGTGAPLALLRSRNARSILWLSSASPTSCASQHDVAVVNPERATDVAAKASGLGCAVLVVRVL